MDRRSFLKVLGTIMAGLGLVPLADLYPQDEVAEPEQIYVRLTTPEVWMEVAGGKIEKGDKLIFLREEESVAGTTVAKHTPDMITRPSIIALHDAEPGEYVRVASRFTTNGKLHLEPVTPHG